MYSLSFNKKKNESKIISLGKSNNVIPALVRVHLPYKDDVSPVLKKIKLQEHNVQVRKNHYRQHTHAERAKMGFSLGKCVFILW